MERTRVGGIIFIDGKLAVMHRKDVIKRPEMPEYYTLPGGGLEQGETLEEGTIREIKEEFGINVKVIKKMYELNNIELDMEEYFYLCEYIDGEFGTGEGEEFQNQDNVKKKHYGEYIPEIVKREEISKIVLLPPEIKEKFLRDIDKV